MTLVSSILTRKSAYFKIQFYILCLVCNVSFAFKGAVVLYIVRVQGWGSLN
jgi:hypothetical protein